jgi:hypothetical protein
VSGIGRMKRRHICLRRGIKLRTEDRQERPMVGENKGVPQNRLRPKGSLQHAKTEQH